MRTYAAIPTFNRGVLFRSRLEAKWSNLFTALQWDWSYEAVDLSTYRIPDFLMNFAHPTIIECKPAVTATELAMYTASLVTTAADWLCSDAERELRDLDDSESDDDLSAIDDRIEYITAVRDRRENPITPGRRALVAGSVMHLVGSTATLDGERRFAWCSGDDVGHAALVEPSGLCLVCGQYDAWSHVPSSTVLEVWRSAGNAAQWRPPA